MDNLEEALAELHKANLAYIEAANMFTTKAANLIAQIQNAYGIDDRE